MNPRAALRFYRRRQQVTAGSVLTGRRLWRRLVPDNPRGNWPEVEQGLSSVVRRSKTDLTGGALNALTDVLAELDLPDDPAGEVLTDQLVDVAADGRDLASLLELPLRHAEDDIDRGRDPQDALDAGMREIEQILRTELADSARQATSLGIAARDGLGYVRMLVPPSCPRCVIMAGRKFRWNDGFQRHPNCDCIHVPADKSIADDLLIDPKVYFDSLSPTDQDATFGKAGAQAIRDGSDMSRVVNARRGMSTTVISGRQLRTTTERARTRGGRRRGPRLMPESIYALSNGDRSEAQRLLTLHGYLTS